MLFLLCYLFHVFNIPLLVCSIQPEVQVQNRYSDTNDNRDWHSRAPIPSLSKARPREDQREPRDAHNGSIQGVSIHYSGTFF